MGPAVEPWQRPQLLGGADDRARPGVLSAGADLAGNGRHRSVDELVIPWRAKRGNAALGRAVPRAAALVVHARAAAPLRSHSSLSSLVNSSKSVLQAELHLAIIDDRGCNLAERGAAQRPVRTTELRGVQEIESLPAELDDVALANPEFLEQREIHRFIGRSIDRAYAD